jgi:hypothetical protein
MYSGFFWEIFLSADIYRLCKLSLAAILAGSREDRTQFWKGAIEGLFHQSLVAIGPVLSEEKIKM